MSEQASTELAPTSVGIHRVERALGELRAGGLVLLLSSDEGRLPLPPFVVAPADQVTPALVERLAELGQGQIYLALSHEQCGRVGLDVSAEPRAAHNPIEAIDSREGIETGLSAEDRAHTIRLASSPAASAQEFVKPGHVVPLRAARRGVVERRGPTEAAVDLVGASGCGEGAVIAPLLASSGSARPAVEVSVEDVVRYRWRTERLLDLGPSAAIPTPHGDFRVIGFQEPISGDVHLAFIHGDLAERREILVSAHRECVLGSNLRGTLCTCAHRLDQAIERTVSQGGVIVYSQISSSARRDNPLASCAEARAAAGEAPAADDPSRLDLQVVGQVLNELKVETVRWLGEPPTGLELPVVSVEPFLPGPR